MTLVVGPGAGFDTSRNVLLALPNWSDVAAYGYNRTLEGDTVITDLVTRQPQDVVGFDVSTGPLTLDATQATRLPLDVVALLRTNATAAAEWSVGVGDSVNEATGAEAYDATANGNDGTMLGDPAPVFVEGKYGGALQFNGTPGQALELPALTATSWTWMAWVNLTSLPAAGRSILDQVGEDAGTVPLARRIGMNSSGRISASDGRAVEVFASGNFLLPSIPSHVAVTYNHATGTLRVVVDFEDVGSDTTTAYAGGLTDTYEVMHVGGDGVGDSMPGWLDDVRFYSRALSIAEIQSEATSETSGLTPDLVGHWRLNAFQSGTPPFGAPPNDPDDELRDGVVFLPYTMTNKHVRIFIADPTNTQPLRIGRAFAGTKIVPPKNFDWGYALPAVTDTKKTKTPSGAKLTTARPVIEQFEFAIKHLPRSFALGVLHKLRSQVGTHRELLCCLDPGDVDYLQRQLIYGQFDELPKLVPEYYEGWSGVSFTVEALG